MAFPIPRVVLAVLLSSMISLAKADTIKIAGYGVEPMIIVADGSCSETTEMAEYIRNFMQERGFAVKDGLSKRASSSNPVQLIIATGDTIDRISGGRWKHTFEKTERDEAYMIEVTKDKTIRIILVGKKPAGVRAATTAFIRKVINDGKNLWLDEGYESKDPFIDKRVLCFGDPMIRQAPKESPFRDADLTFWTLDEVYDYPELFWQFGFNGCQVGASRGYGSLIKEDWLVARTTSKILARGAKRHKMFVSCFTWGESLFDEFIPYSWNCPKQRRIMEYYHRELAECFGPLVDHVLVHVGDPGGATECGADSYKTRQELANYIYREYQKINTEIEVSLSTWGNWEFWKCSPVPVDISNYGIFGVAAGTTISGRPVPGGGEFLDSTFMPREMGIALNRFYHEQQADLVIDSGRFLDIWGWYISDHEMRNNMAFNMQNIDRYFRNIPKKARDQIHSYSAEINFHGWPQSINSYIVAQKMWSPDRPLDDIEREFCTAVFSPQNTDAMIELYHACEGGWSADIPQPPDFGTKSYNKHLRKTLNMAGGVTLPENWKPNFNIQVSAQKYVDMLTARLKLILAVSEAKTEIDRARKKLNISARKPMSDSLGKEMVFQVLDRSDSSLISITQEGIPVMLKKGHSLGQSFSVIRDFSKIGVTAPTWQSSDSGFTISLYDKAGGKLLASKEITNHKDREIAWLHTDQTAGRYYLEVANPTGTAIGVYMTARDVYPEGEVYYDRRSSANISENQVIKKIKQKAIENLPHLPIDPIYNQDETIVHPTYRTPTFSEMIERL